MDWKALKDNKCPICGQALKNNERYYACINDDCEFMCSVQKFNLITSGRGTLRYATYSHQNVEENLSELNSL